MAEVKYMHKPMSLAYVSSILGEDTKVNKL